MADVMLRADVLASLQETPAIVLDCGSRWSRTGLSGDAQPRYVAPSVVASYMGTGYAKETDHFGEEAYEYAKRPKFKLRYPIECSCITNWDEIEKLWRHMITQGLNLNPEEQPVVLVEPALSATVTREKTAQVMFETFEVPALALVRSPEACLAGAEAGNTGLVVELGAGSCLPAAVLEGYVLRMCVSKTLLSGNELTWYMLQLLHEAGHTLVDASTQQKIDLASQVKQRLCYVTQDLQKEEEHPGNTTWSGAKPDSGESSSATSNSTGATLSAVTESESTSTTSTTGALTETDSGNFTLPDGTVISVGRRARYLCPESIFQPALCCQEMPGLHEIVRSTILRCDSTLRPAMMANILLCGASSLFPGMAERFLAEMEALFGVEAEGKVKVTHTKDPHLAFNGACRLAATEDFPQRYLTKEFYDEYGPSAVARHFV